MNAVLVAGEINVDLVLGGCTAMPQPDTEVLCESFRQVPGSSSMICAMGLARLGRAVRFAGRAGADEYGRFCVQALNAAGVDVTATRLEPELATGVTVSLSTGTDRALVTCPGSIAALAADDLDDAAFVGVGHLHVSSYYLQRRLRPGMPALFARARAAGLTISLDPGSDPARTWGSAQEWARVLPLVDVFLPSRAEAMAIAGTTDLSTALTTLDNGHTRIVVKCSADGALVRDEHGVLREVPSRAPQQVFDTTGAGDSFNAGFLHAWLDQRPLETCLRWGNACGALSTRAIGGTAGQPDEAELKRWLEQAP